MRQRHNLNSVRHGVLRFWKNVSPHKHRYPEKVDHKADQQGDAKVLDLEAEYEHTRGAIQHNFRWKKREVREMMHSAYEATRRKPSERNILKSIAVYTKGAD